MSNLKAPSLYLKTLLFFDNLFSTALSVLKVLILSNTKNKIPLASNTQCVVLGNGPSLKNSLTNHLDFFKNKELFCVNNFASSESYTELKPQNYIIMDPSFWKFEGSINPALEKMLNDLKEKTTWNLRFFIPNQARKSEYLQAFEKENTNIHISYFNYTVFRGFQNISFFIYRLGLGMPQCQNVVVACLFLAINMKFKEIYLLGADHNWHESLIVDDQNVVCLKHHHFYDKDSNIAYRKFYKDTLNKEAFTMKEIFQTWAKVFYGYEVLSKYAEALKVKVYNSSEVSFIDAFERKKL